MTAALATWSDLPDRGPLMSENFKRTLLATFKTLMRPLVRILLRNGVSYGEFAELLKSVFVDSAQDVLQMPGSKQSVPRLAISTGLSRFEVGRLLDRSDAEFEALAKKFDRIGSILTGWHQDADFIGPYGIPYEVVASAPVGRRSFAELVRRYTPDVPAEEMLDELKRINAVLELGNGCYRVVSRSYIPAPEDPGKFHEMAVAFTDLAKTLDQNLKPEASDKLFERRVWTPTGIAPEAAIQFDEFVKDRGQQFLELLDDWLTTKETFADKARMETRVRVGVAMYMFVRPQEVKTDETPGA